MKQQKKITVLAAETQAQIENHQCDVEEEWDTIAQAKKRAKYYLTEEYMDSVESTTMLGSLSGARERGM